MPNQGREISPTRSAALALKEEYRLVREGYEFLDEKRLLLAAEMLRQLDRYQRLIDHYLGLHKEAREALAQATARHGLEGLWVYPAAAMDEASLRIDSRSFLGVRLVETRLAVRQTRPRAPAINPSPEAERCPARHRVLIETAAELAGLAGNLYRLSREYQRTERRARALENVLLPEIDATLKEIEEHLEALDLEETVQLRKAYGARRASSGS